jgi:hypothetical protein
LINLTFVLFPGATSMDRMLETLSGGDSQASYFLI